MIRGVPFSVGPDWERTLRSWSILLQRGLSFGNFEGFEWLGTIEAGQERSITHGLRIIPTHFVVLDSKGSCTIIRGDTAWTDTHAYFKNKATTSDFIGKILIMP